MPERFNGYDAGRFLRARILGGPRPRRNWVGDMWPEMRFPPQIAFRIPPMTEKQKPPAREAEGS